MSVGSGDCKDSVKPENTDRRTDGGATGDQPSNGTADPPPPPPSGTAGPPPPPPSSTAKVSTPASGEPAEEETIPFTCHLCGLSEQCHYRGARPPFSRSVQLAEPGYVMRDPFSARGAGQLMLLLGADCALCGRAVCQDAGCSLFYVRRFCLPCARERVSEFPPQLRDKIGA